MSKVTLTPLVNLQNETTAVNAINNNSAVITTAFDNTLSRDGAAPNQMLSNLDMNSQRILNLVTPISPSEPLRLGDLGNIVGTIGITGTSGHTIPFLDGNNTYSGTANFTGASNTFSGSLSVAGGITTTGSGGVGTSITSVDSRGGGATIAMAADFLGLGLAGVYTTGATSLALGTSNTSRVSISATGNVSCSSTTGGTSTTAAAVTAKSLGLTENLYAGGVTHISSLSGGVSNITAPLTFAYFINGPNSPISHIELFTNLYGLGVSLGHFNFATGGDYQWFNSGATLASTPIMTLSATGALNVGGSILSIGTSGVGYGVGAGGVAPTQITNRNTGVTLNKTSGDITLIVGVNAAISGATANTMTITNSTVAVNDTIIVNQKSGTDKYLIFVTNTSAGSFTITYYTTGGTTNESPVFHFNVIKGVIT